MWARCRGDVREIYLHKPDQQTLLAPRAVTALLDPLPVDRLRGFGGKLADPNPNRSHGTSRDASLDPQPSPSPAPEQASWARRCGWAG